MATHAHLDLLRVSSLQVYVLWDESAHRRRQSRVLMAVLQLFGYSNSATNSFVYCWFSENFQKHLVRDTVAAIVCCCRRRRRATRPDKLIDGPRLTSDGRGGVGVGTAVVRWPPMAVTSVDTPTGCPSLQSHHLTTTM